MELQEKLRIVAEYDGWEYESEEWEMMYKISDAFWYCTDERFDNERITDLSETQYNTSFSWLIPVASKLCDELYDRLKEKDTHSLTIHNIITHIFKLRAAGSSFKIEKLFEACVSAIELLNNLKSNLKNKTDGE